MTWPANTAFSPDIPQLQVAWDSTSMGTFKECPQKYFYSIVEGWQPKATSVHLVFGQHYHKALERYDHSKARGATHDQACLDAMQQAMEDSWDYTLGKPWFSDHPQKNRYTLVRTVVWYLEQFKDDPFTTVILANGKPAVELSFRMELPFVAPTGVHFMLSGHLDRLAKMQDGEPFILDRKTTSSTISQDFFRKFTPDNQFSTYILAGNIVSEQPVKRLIVDAAQIAVTFSRFERGMVDRHPSVVNEWARDLGLWLGQASAFAMAGVWPKNDKSCNNYGGCPFRGVCSKPPETREQWLNADYTKRIWDPLQVRGDI